MKLFISGEIDGRFGDEVLHKFTEVINKIENILNDKLRTKEYGEDITSIAIIPVVMKSNDQMQKDGWFRERKLFQRKKHSADYRLRIDFDIFLAANNDKAADLILKNIIDAIRDLSRKAQHFEAKELENDILKLFNKQYDDL